MYVHIFGMCVYIYKYEELVGYSGLQENKFAQWPGKSRSLLTGKQKELRTLSVTSQVNGITPRIAERPLCQYYKESNLFL